MKIGDRVCVQTSVKVYHYPTQRNQPVDLEGKIGEIVATLTTYKEQPISANWPYKVRFEKKFSAHFSEAELCIAEP